LPLNDVDAATIHTMEFHQEAPASGRYAYYPGTTEVPESTAARTLGASFKALAEVEFTKDTRVSFSHRDHGSVAIHSL
jgi:arylsulfatase